MKRYSFFILAIALLLSGGGCKFWGDTVEVQDTTISETEAYKATLFREPNIENGEDGWRLIITEKNNGIGFERALYSDTFTFVDFFYLSWIWEGDDRFWVFDNDTGDVFMISSCSFAEECDVWEKHDWGHRDIKWIEEDVWPPNELYPLAKEDTVSEDI